MNEFRLIRLALALGEHGNFARAAEALGVSQPSVTRGIADLERALGVPLFDRTRRGVVPTPFGRVVLERGEALLRSHASLHHELTALAGLEAGALTICAGPFPSEISIPTAIARLTRAYPNLMIRCRTADPAEVLSDVLNERADIGVAHLVAPDDADRLIVRPAPPLRIYIACRPGHPITDVAAPTFGDVTDYPLVSNILRGPPAAAVRQRDGSLDAEATFATIFMPQIAVDSVEMCRQVARDSDALFPCTASMVADHVASGKLVVLEIDAPVLRTVHSIYYLRDRTLSPAAEVFVATLEAVEAELADKEAQQA